MACQHRFKNELLPNWKIKYLFIGTFNPEWNNKNNNAAYFYGRNTNDFWYIMPQVFNNDSLMDKKYRTDKECLIKFLKENEIGLTDLISIIKNVSEDNPVNKNDLLSFKDKKIEKYEIEFNICNIKKLIDNNKELIGVYFTRNIDNKSIICQKWIEIKEYCKRKKINANELITPSRGYRRNGYNRDKKLEDWKEIILKQCPSPSR